MSGTGIGMTTILLCAGGGLVAVLIVAFLWGLAVYNGLVGSRNQVRNSFSQIDVQLKRRHDLIPNLVETVKGYAKHEAGTLEKVMQARAGAMGAQGVEAKGQAESILSGALGQLRVVFEAYPDLKANTNFLALQEELSSTENKIAFSRQAYNDEVMRYNTKIQTIPSNLVAGVGGFRAEPFFEIEGGERQSPKVQF